MKKLIFTTMMFMIFIHSNFSQEANLVSFTLPEEKQTELEIADTTDTGFSISGSIDLYFRSNLDADYEIAPATSFANLPGFSLGMANVILTQESKKYGFTADLVFGPRGEDATFLSSELRPGGNSSIVNQLYVYYQLTPAVTLTVGNFNTFLGYEVITPTSNFNYSTSYMFSYGPFSHTGLKADFDLAGGFSFMAGVFNPTDATEFNPTGEIVGGIQIGYENDKVGVWFNSLFSEGFSQYDLTAGYNLSDKLYLGLNATLASDNFYGIAGYGQYEITDIWKVGLRVEYFKDKGIGIFSATDQEESVMNYTLSANYQVGNFTLIPELRLDSFSSKVVANEDSLDDSLSSILLAAVYGF